MKEFKYVIGASNLPDEWDKLADNFFQQKNFLIHTEKYNSCQQRYYLFYENEKFVSGAIMYSIRLDILTFLRVKSPIKMHVVGIPCSVSSSGIFGNSISICELTEHIYKVQKGFVLVLNLKEKSINGSYASGNTLPTIVLSNHFDNWENYVSSLRSSYRRRLKNINLKNDYLKFEKKKCSEFTTEMYKQYINVYKKSEDKLEKLSYDFFKNLSSNFLLNVCLAEDKMIGWNITLTNKNNHYFFLGGIDYSKNKKFNTYFNLLTLVIRSGIENKSAIIDLGQTAEIPKIRLGGKPVSLYMEAKHSNFLLNKLLIYFSNFLVYKKVLENSHVLKKVAK